jgi:hypothetical protein
MLLKPETCLNQSHFEPLENIQIKVMTVFYLGILFPKMFSDMQLGGRRREKSKVEKIESELTH